ncbi:DUF1707 domain-containing protein [Streptomyces sp. NPDC048496]|uniref:DUF1707 SHOCT-like domain-containing protein n=1 Tax=Streptomyces sp. NPDC048496 TaxID=3365558 RepID=UPI00372370FC
MTAGRDDGEISVDAGRPWVVHRVLVVQFLRESENTVVRSSASVGDTREKAAVGLAKPDTELPLETGCSRFTGTPTASRAVAISDVAGLWAVHQNACMTGELRSAGDSSEHGTTPELRASDRDRDQVVEILQVAAGDGRLTAAELDERLDAALSARTTGDLAGLTADLPSEGMPPQARDLVRIDQRFGDVTRTGRWLVPRRMEIRLMFCDAKLDFTDAMITHNTLHIDVDLRVGGNLILVTRPGIEVDTDDLVRGSGDIKIRPVSGPDTPITLRVQLAGQSRGGDIIARPPRRKFSEWLRRRTPRSIGR